jgi:hypothetical protein
MRVLVLAARVGLDPKDFAGHSIRAGFVTTCVEAGAPHIDPNASGLFAAARPVPRPRCRIVDLGDIMPDHPDPAETTTVNNLAAECESIFTRIEAARARIEKAYAQAWADYMELAEKLGAVSRIAMRRAGVNRRKGAGYTREMRRLLALKAPKLGEHERLRAALLNIHEHRSDFDIWRDQLTDRERERWRSPLTLWDRFDAHRERLKRVEDPAPRSTDGPPARVGTARFPVPLMSPEAIEKLVRETDRVGLDAVLRPLGPSAARTVFCAV